MQLEQHNIIVTLFVYVVNVNPIIALFLEDGIQCRQQPWMNTMEFEGFGHKKANDALSMLLGFAKR